MPENRFGERAVERCELEAERSAPAVVDPALVWDHYLVEDGELEVFSGPFRYVWQSELDLMARLAGMTLRERWAGWRREPVTSESAEHVSVWERRRRVRPGSRAVRASSGGRTTPRRATGRGRWRGG